MCVYLLGHYNTRMSIYCSWTIFTEHSPPEKPKDCFAGQEIFAPFMETEVLLPC